MKTNRSFVPSSVYMPEAISYHAFIISTIRFYYNGNVFMEKKISKDQESNTRSYKIGLCFPLKK